MARAYEPAFERLEDQMPEPRNTFGADADEDVTDWGEENMEEKRRALQPTQEQLHRAAAKWQAERGCLHEDHGAYFYENWQALPGLRQFVEAEIAADDDLSSMYASAEKLDRDDGIV